MDEQIKQMIEGYKTLGAMHSAQLESVIQQNREMLNRQTAQAERVDSLLTLIEDRVIGPMDENLDDLMTVTESLQGVATRLGK